MPAESRHVTWVGLEVTDRERYARYRAAMASILAEYGGRFEHDFEVSRVLAPAASPRLNRVFALSFPNAGARGRFYADGRYRRVREAWFEPAVARRESLGVYDAQQGDAS